MRSLRSNMPESQSLGPSTRSVHLGNPEAVPGNSVNNPIYQTSTFFSDPDGAGEVLYTRYGNNPNQVALERRIAALEGAEDCVAVGSGMAAMTCALLACVGAGDHVVAARALYGGTRILLDRELARLGIETTYVDFGDSNWQSALRGRTRVLLVEVPANPLLRIVDLAPIAQLASGRDLPLLVDATFATPINFRPLEHGAHLVVHSATKYFGGHSDVTAGAVAGRAELVSDVRARARTFGPALDPHAAWLTERGIKTLAVRMERHNRNGMTVAQWCETQPRIARVHYPGLASHPDHELARLLFDGFGAMIAVELEGGAGAASRFVRALRLAKLAPSLGGVETLVSEPRHTSHASLTADERRQIGIADGFVRFSLGIEDAEDIIGDIEQALAALD
jgi:cystathionine beta-lyase/cystathionine gamma-synthase